MRPAVYGRTAPPRTRPTAGARALRPGPAGPGSGQDQPLAHRVEDGLRAIEDAELDVDATQVVAHRLDRDAEAGRDLLGGQAGGDQREDLDLAGGQPVVGSGPRAGAEQPDDPAAGR